MKISNIEPIPLSLPVSRSYQSLTPVGSKNRVEMLLVRVTTDSGIIGYGEAFCALSMGRKATIAVLQDMIAPVAIGRDPTQISMVISDLHRHIYPFGRSGITMLALSCLDIALWDIAGKLAGLPLSKLLGNSNIDTLSCGASIRHCEDAQALVARTELALSAGYRTIKIHESDPKRARLVRELIGNEIPLVVDANCDWAIGDANNAIPELIDLDLLFLEDPLWPPEDFSGLAGLHARFGIPLAAGGNYSNAWEFQQVISTRSVQYCQPSVTVAGGISEVVNVKALADLHDVMYTPHSPYFGPAYLASLHLAAALGSPIDFFRNLMSPDVDLFNGKFIPQRGTVRVPTGPGLGSDPDSEILTRYRAD